MEQLSVADTTKVQIEAFENAGKKLKEETIHRWQKYTDTEGTLWIVVCVYGHKMSGPGTEIQLLSVDKETTIDIPRSEFLSWVQERRLTRINSPVIF